MHFQTVIFFPLVIFLLFCYIVLNFEVVLLYIKYLNAFSSSLIFSSTSVLNAENYVLIRFIQFLDGSSVKSMMNCLARQ